MIADSQLDELPGVLVVALLGLARLRRSRPPVALLVVAGAGLAIVVLGLEARTVGAIDATGAHAVAALDRARWPRPPCSSDWPWCAARSTMLCSGPVWPRRWRGGSTDVPTARHALDMSGPLVERTLERAHHARPLR